MNKRQEKSFIITNIIISAITLIIIWIVCYLMKDMEWWQTMLALFSILICSMVTNTFNIVFHLKSKKNKE